MKGKYTLQLSEVIKRLFPKEYFGHTFKCMGVKDVVRFLNYDYDVPQVTIEVSPSESGKTLSLYSYSVLVTEKMSKNIDSIIQKAFEEVNESSDLGKPADRISFKYVINGGRTYEFLKDPLYKSIIGVSALPSIKGGETYNGELTLKGSVFNCNINYNYKLIRPGISLTEHGGGGNNDVDSLTVTSFVKVVDIMLDPIGNEQPLDLTFNEEDEYSNIDELLHKIKSTKSFSEMADIMFEKSSNGVEYRQYVRSYLTGGLGNETPIIKCTPKILTTINEVAIEDGVERNAFPHGTELVSALEESMWLKGINDLEATLWQEVYTDYPRSDEMSRFGTDDYLCYALLESYLHYS